MLIALPDHAAQIQCRPPPPDPAGPLQSDELARLRDRASAARLADNLVYGRGDRGLAGAAADHAGRSGALLGSRDRDVADPASGFPPAAAPDRGVGRLLARADGAGPAGARPFDLEPASQDAGGGSPSPDDERTGAPAGRQHRREAERSGWSRSMEPSVAVPGGSYTWASMRRPARSSPRP